MLFLLPMLEHPFYELRLFNIRFDTQLAGAQR